MTLIELEGHSNITSLIISSKNSKIINNFINNSNNDSSNNVENLSPFIAVASGDPTINDITLLAILRDDPTPDLSLSYMISDNENMSNIIKEGSATINYEIGTAKAQINNLLPDNIYYYQFKLDDKLSDIGRTRTFPENTNEMRLIMCSCSESMTAGPLRAYDKMREVIEEKNVHAVIHQGDFVYEMGIGEKEENSFIMGIQFPGYNDNQEEGYYKTNPLPEYVRGEPRHRVRTLNDAKKLWRWTWDNTPIKKVAKYCPLICQHDDHDSGINDWSAEHDLGEEWELAFHNPATDGSYIDRNRAMLRAWWGFVPISKRGAPDFYGGTHETRGMNYINIKLGNIGNMILTESRYYRDKPIYAKDITPDGYDKSSLGSYLESRRTLHPQILAYADASGRSHFGAQQNEWIHQQLQNTDISGWFIFGNSGPCNAEYISLTLEGLTEAFIDISNITISELISEALPTINKYNKDASEFDINIDGSGDIVKGYSMDSMDGYYYESQQIRNAMIARGKCLAITGDEHVARLIETDISLGIIAEVGSPSISSVASDRILRPIYSIPIIGWNGYVKIFDNIEHIYKYKDRFRKGFTMLEITENNVNVSHYLNQLVDASPPNAILADTTFAITSCKYDINGKILDLSASHAIPVGA